MNNENEKREDLEVDDPKTMKLSDITSENLSTLDIKTFTVPRVIFFIVFTFINGYVAASTYGPEIADFILSFLVGGLVAFLFLGFGNVIGQSFAKKYSRNLAFHLHFEIAERNLSDFRYGFNVAQIIRELIDEYRGIYGEAIGLIMAIIFELGFIIVYL